MRKVDFIAQIDNLRVAYGTIKRIDPTGPAYAKLVQLLDSMDNDLLVIVKDASIPFVSSLAWNRCVRRGLA